MRAATVFDPFLSEIGYPFWPFGLKYGVVIDLCLLEEATVRHWSLSITPSTKVGTVL